MASAICNDTNYYPPVELGLAEVNPDLARRMGLIEAALRGYCSEQMIALERAVMAIREAEGEQEELIEELGSVEMGIARIKREEEADELAALRAQKGQILARLLQIEERVKQLNETKAKIAASHERPLFEASGVSLLERAMRTFDVAWFEQNAPFLQDETQIVARFSSMIRDIQRPLVQFRINGREVFQKERFKQMKEKEIHSALAQELDQYHLPLTDLFCVLEFYHQGGTAVGPIQLNKFFDPVKNGIKGIGPEAILDLVIDSCRFQLVSVANCVVTDSDAATEDSFGIQKIEGIKKCTTIYDFRTGKVRLNILNLPISDEEMKKIDDEGHNRH